MTASLSVAKATDIYQIWTWNVNSIMPFMSNHQWVDTWDHCYPDRVKCKDRATYGIGTGKKLMEIVGAEHIKIMGDFNIGASDFRKVINGNKIYEKIKLHSTIDDKCYSTKDNTGGLNPFNVDLLIEWEQN